MLRVIGILWLIHVARFCEDVIPECGVGRSRLRIGELITVALSESLLILECSCWSPGNAHLTRKT